jgi:septum formation protein
VIESPRVPAAPGLILASTSVYRRALLERLRVPFTVIAPVVDELRSPDEPAQQRAKRLALEKAQAVAVQHRRAVVIGADQVASCDGAILDKPGNAQSARAQLKQQSGRPVDFFSAVAVVCAERGFTDHFVDRTTVQFRTLSAAEIEAYLIADAPYDCAGSLRSEALGLSLCERVETVDPTGLIGLPLIRLAAALRSCGYAVP